MLASLLLVEPARLSQAIAQVPLLQDERFAGLQLARITSQIRERS